MYVPPCFHTLYNFTDLKKVSWEDIESWALYPCRTRMDVMRIDSGDGARRFCVCVASYGYMGDLMKDSEKMRIIGPARYNLAGAMALFRNKVGLCYATTVYPHPAWSSMDDASPECPVP